MRSDLEVNRGAPGLRQRHTAGRPARARGSCTSGIAGHSVAVDRVRVDARLPLEVGTVLVVDVLRARLRPNLVALGAMDESAHVATSLLLSRSLRTVWSGPALLGLLAGSVLIDLDHLPGLLARHFRLSLDRPCSHSLWTVGVLGLLAYLVPGVGRRVVLGSMFGVAAHLVRDMATGGVPLWWPANRSRVRLPYLAYVVVLLAALGTALQRANSQ